MAELRDRNRMERKSELAIESERKEERGKGKKERCRNTDNTGNIEFFGKRKRWRWIKAGKKRETCLRKVRKQLKHWIKKGER